MDTLLNREFEFTSRDFEFLRRMAGEMTGIAVGEDKLNMFYSRLVRRLRALGLQSFRSYCHYLTGPDGEQESREFINAITTNLTAFFREKHHFEFLATVALPELLVRNRRERRLRIWSAGCSTGEEPYSLAMTLLESVPRFPEWDASVLATDIDSNVLARAASGIFDMAKVSEIERSRLRRWFLKGKGVQTGKAKAKPAIRQIIDFRHLNLLGGWSISDVDIIFCRNVIIYFAKPSKKLLVDKFANALPLGGYLCIGHSESLHRLTDRFELAGNTTYRKIA